MEVFFPGIKGISHPYESEGCSVECAAGLLFDQLRDAKPLSREDLIEIFCSRWDLYDAAERAIPDNRDADMDARKSVWQAQRAHVRKLATEAADVYMKQPENEGKNLYRVEFHDDTSLGCLMEHGSAIPDSPVPSFRISHH